MGAAHCLSARAAPCCVGTVLPGTVPPFLMADPPLSAPIVPATAIPDIEVLRSEMDRRFGSLEARMERRFNQQTWDPRGRHDRPGRCAGGPWLLHLVPSVRGADSGRLRTPCVDCYNAPWDDRGRPAAPRRPAPACRPAGPAQRVTGRLTQQRETRTAPCGAQPSTAPADPRAGSSRLRAPCLFP